MKAPPQTDELYWALVDHARGWISSDAFRVKLVQLNGDRLNEKLVRRIARDYAVGRGIVASENGDDAAGKGIARLANNALEQWGPTLCERAEACSRLASKFQDKGYTHKYEASLATKLMWFLAPKGWTVFDRYAADALGTRNCSVDIRMPLFYETLELNGFSDFSKKIQKRIKVSEYQHLHGTRVIDALLTRRGGRQANALGAGEQAPHFLTQLPTSARNDLDYLARTVSDDLSDHKFMNALPENMGE